MKKKLTNEEYFKENKKKIYFLDALIIAAIFFNIFALVITNTLVVKANPDHEIREAAAATAEIWGFEKHPEGNTIVKLFLYKVLFWSLIIGFYIYSRFNLRSMKRYYLLLCYALPLCVLTGFDFFNNFGYLIGRALYG